MQKEREDFPDEKHNALKDMEASELHFYKIRTLEMQYRRVQSGVF